MVPINMRHCGANRDMKTSFKGPVKISTKELRNRVDKCDVLIVAAGFEERALKLTESLENRIPRRIVVARYAHKLNENERTYKKLMQVLSAFVGVETAVVSFDPRSPDSYLGHLKSTISKWRPDIGGEVWVDISAFTMQGICMTLAALRETLGSASIRVIYTEAQIYYPKKEEVEKKGKAFAALSLEMAGNLIPKRFAGVSNDSATCLLLFAGYEKHRSIGVVDELNPAKVALIFGKPPREDLQWRLEWSNLFGNCFNSRSARIIAIVKRILWLSFFRSQYCGCSFVQ